MCCVVLLRRERGAKGRGIIGGKRGVAGIESLSAGLVERLARSWPPRKSPSTPQPPSPPPSPRLELVELLLIPALGVLLSSHLPQLAPWLSNPLDSAPRGVDGLLLLLALLLRPHSTPLCLKLTPPRVGEGVGGGMSSMSDSGEVGLVVVVLIAVVMVVVMVVWVWVVREVVGEVVVVGDGLIKG
jgi:hypothetical protein